MLLGAPPEVAAGHGSWVAALPMAAALALLVLTGIAWPPGLGDALALAARVVGP
jgi:hypothetical protein